jgi:hypothetical protein
VNGGIWNPREIPCVAVTKSVRSSIIRRGPFDLPVMAVGHQQGLHSLRSVIFQRKGWGAAGDSLHSATGEEVLLQRVPVGFRPQSSPVRGHLAEDQLGGAY